MSNSRNLNKRGKSVRVLQAAIAASAFAVPLIEAGSTRAAAVSQYWDLNGSVAGAGGATAGSPTGTWDTTSSLWNSNSAGTAATTTFTTGNNAFFSAGTDATSGYTVTVDAGGVSANAIFIEDGTPTFAGGTITLTGTGTNIEPGAQGTVVLTNATFAGVIAGTVGVRVARNFGNPNIITFATTNTFTGGLSINLGNTVRMGVANAIPSTNLITTGGGGGGTLDLNSKALTVSGLQDTSLGGDIVLGSATLTITGAANAIYQADNISGTGGITLTGGSQELSTNYIYTGATKVSGGVLKIDSLQLGGTKSSIGMASTAATNLVINGGTLMWLGETTLAASGLSTDRQFQMGADGATLDSESSIDACTFGGAMTNTATSGTQTLTLAGGGTFGNLISGAIPNGSGTSQTAIVKNGAGTWVFGSSANSYTGGVTVNGGTLRLAAANALPSANSITVSGGTLDLNGQSLSVLSVALNSGSIIGTSSTLTSATDFAVQSGTVTANLAGSVGLTKTTAGIATITGNQTYTGNTTVSGGTLFFNGGNTQSVGTIDVLSNAKVGGTSFFNGPVTVEAGGHFVAGNGQGTGTTALTAAGTGTIEFKAGANLDFTLLANGQSDTLDASAAPMGALTFDGTAGQTFLNITASGGGMYPIIGYDGTYNTPGNIGIAEFTTTPNVTLSDNGFDTIFAQVAFNQSEWQNAAGGDWFVGTNWNAGIPNATGATALLGNNISTDQVVNLSANATVGLLTFDNTNAARYTLSTTNGSTLTMSSPGIAAIQDNNGSHTINVGVQLSSDTIVTVSNSADSVTFGGAITGTGALTTAGAGNVLISNTVVDSAGITNSGSGSLMLTNAVSGAGGIVNSGTGTIFLSGTNSSYTGKVAISSGMISVTNDAALGAAPGFYTVDAISIGNNAIFQFTGSMTLGATRGIQIAQNGSGTIDVASGKVVTYGGTISSSGAGSTTTLVKSGAGVFDYTDFALATTNYNKLLITGGTFDISSSNALPAAPAFTANLVTLNGGTFQIVSSVGTFSSNRGITLGASGGGLGSGSGATNVWSAVIAGASGSGALTISGAGTLTLSGTNTYTGGTNLNATGILQIANNAALGTGTLSLQAGTIQSDSATARALSVPVSVDGNVTVGGTGGMTLSGAMTLTGNRTITFSNTAATTFSGVIGQSGGAQSLTKLGSGTLALTKANTYSGGTTVSGGTIILANNAALGTGDVTFGGAIIQGNSAARSVANNFFLHITGGVTFAGATSDKTTYTGNIVIDAARNLNVTSAGETTLSGTISETGGTWGVTKRGNGSLTLSGNNTYTGGFAQGSGTDGGTTTVTAGFLEAPTGSLTITVGTLNLNNAAQTVGNLAGTGGSLVLGAGNTLTVNETSNKTTATPITGAGSLVYNANASGVVETLSSTANGYTGSTTVSGGTLKLQGNLLTTSSVSMDSTNGFNSTLQLATGGGQNYVLKTPTVSATHNGKIDVQDNKMIVTVTPIGSLTGNTYGGVQGLVQSGFNNGGWNGSGIITGQTYAAGLNALTTLAVATAGDINYGGTNTFSGQTVNTTDTLVMYTYNGDMNLDGTINGDDYMRIDAGFASHGAMTGYENGDLNYDGKINADDYFIIDKNYSHTTDLGTFPHAPVLDGLAGVTAVPEPTSLALLALATTTLRRRRRRS